MITDNCKALCKMLLSLVFSGLCLMLVCCSDHDNNMGVEWVPPKEQSMPAAFSSQAAVPEYAHAWRMPEGFRGFPERWNKRNKDFVAKSYETAQIELSKAEQAL